MPEGEGEACTEHRTVSKKCGLMGVQRSLLPCKVVPVWLLSVSPQCPAQLRGWIRAGSGNQNVHGLTAQG